MEQNLITAPIIEDNSLQNNIDLHNVPNKIIDDIISIDLEIIDFIKTDENALCNTLDEFEANELPIEAIIHLTNNSSEDEEEEQTIASDHASNVHSDPEGKFLAIYGKIKITH